MDRQEFTQRVLSMNDKMYRIAYGQLRNTYDCCDAVQEAILKAWSSRDKLRKKEFFETWLIRILINECHDIQRRRKRVSPLDYAPEHANHISEDISDVHDAVLALEEKYRLPIILHYMSGYTTEEIGRILHLPTGTVRSRLKRARERLKTELESQ
ncbi:MAG: sigma-70 family RNA polymerase sigma factor [Clostridia bacterium]|nr:sigma-70 family RNA polymerase sigma factor [Clostridia bacterium]